MHKIKVTEIIKGLYHLQFPTNYLMNATLIRFQEYYESPKFKGKPFTLEEYMDWYVLAEEGKFDYFEWVEGVNIPTSVLVDFNKAVQSELGRKERILYNYFKHVGVDGYIIATSKTSYDGVLMHETAHGIYDLKPKYRREVQAFMRSKVQYKLVVKEIYKYLKDKHYHRKLYRDEAHAYILNGAVAVDMHIFTGYGRDVFKEMTRGLRKIYRRHLEKSRIDKRRKDLVL